MKKIAPKYPIDILHEFCFSARFDADQFNKLKNMVSKVIGEKMKVSVKSSKRFLNSVSHIKTFCNFSL